MSTLVPENVAILHPTLKAPVKPRRRKADKEVSRVRAAALAAANAHLDVAPLRQPVEAVEAQVVREPEVLVRGQNCPVDPTIAARARLSWSGVGRGLVGIMLAGTGIAIAVTSIRANN